MESELYFKSRAIKRRSVVPKSIIILTLIALTLLVAIHYYQRSELNSLKSAIGIKDCNEEVTKEAFAEFLRQDVISNPSKPLPHSYYSPGPDLDWQYISSILRGHRFDELNKILDTYQKGPAISKQGIPNIWDADGFTFIVTDLATLNDYCHRYPGSPWAFLLRAEFYSWYSWQVTGTGLANKITNADWRLMKQRLNHALKDYMRAARRNPNLAYAYVGAGYSAIHIGLRGTALQLYRKALSLDPAGWEILNALLDNSKSKWYGPDDQLMFQFARGIAAKHPEYPYLERLIIKAHEEMAWRYAHGDRDKVRQYLCQPQVWNEITSIYKRLLFQYPESNYVKKYLYEISNLAGKPDEFDNLVFKGKYRKKKLHHSEDDL